MPRVQRGDRRRRVRVPGGQPDGRSRVLYSGGLCAECEETFYSAYTACEECADGARRCVDTATHIQFEDDALLSGATCMAGLPTDALLVTGNRVVKCGAGHFVQPETCGACQEGCVACRDGMSSDICDVMTGVC